MADRPSAAAALYPHLISGKPAEPERRHQATSPLAASMYPNHVPKPPPPTPRPRPTREEIYRDFSRNMNADPEYARMIGFRKVR
jgi:hypothetical protein